MVTCALCHSNNIHIIQTKIRNLEDVDIKVYCCEKCGVQFLYPAFSDEQLKQYYNHQYRLEYTDNNYYLTSNIESFYKRSLPEARLRLNRVKQFLGSQDNILEIGCSSGYFLSEIAPFVSGVNGTEWDQGNMEYAKSLGLKVEKNIEDFNTKFDKIFMFHVLEHIRNPIDFLKNISNFLQPDGILFIEVPNNEDVLLTTYAIQEFKDFYYQSAHIWYFNQNSLQYLLRESGFKSRIIPVQRYDISNHIHWLKERIPGGQKKYAHIFSDVCNDEYVRGLKKERKTDTLFTICTMGGTE